MKNKLIINDTKDLDKAEIVCEIGGNFFPPLKLAGLFISSFNKKYAEENLNMLVRYINDLNEEIEIFKYRCDEEKRNFSFNFNSLLQKVINERNREKIKVYSLIFVEGIKCGSIFVDDDDFQNIIYLIDNLLINDILVLRIIDELTFNDALDRYEEFDRDKLFEKIKGKDCEENFEMSIEKMTSLGLISKQFKINLGVQKNALNINHDIFISYKLTSVFSSFKKILIDK